MTRQRIHVVVQDLVFQIEIFWLNVQIAVSESWVFVRVEFLFVFVFLPIIKIVEQPIYDQLLLFVIHSGSSGNTPKIEYGYIALKNILKSKRIAYKNIVGAFDRIIYTKLVTKIANKKIVDRYNALNHDVDDNKDGVDYKEKELIVYRLFNNFYYWEEYKNKQEFDAHKNPGFRYCDLYIQPKYLNLKDEILNNDVYSLSSHHGVAKWDKIRIKAIAFLKTYEFRNNYHAKEWNYGIPKNALLSVENVIALILYTDFSKLSASFAETYVARSCTDTLDDIKQRHRNYHWFAKSLNVVIELFGSSMSDGEYFYHCINIPLCVNSTVCRFNHVYSMTNSFEVASNFSVNNGILLKLKSYDWQCSRLAASTSMSNAHRINYFNVNLISSFSNEYEKLFIGYDGKHSNMQQPQLQISDIIMCLNGNKYLQYLRALNILMAAMNGEYPNDYHSRQHRLQQLQKQTSAYMCGGLTVSCPKGKHLSIRKKDKKLVKSMIAEKTHKFDEYLQAVFSKYKSSKNIVIIDLYLMKKKHVYSFMASYFLSSSSNSSLKYVIKLHILSSLFENLSKIIITNGSGYHHSAIVISSHYLTYILSSLSSLSQHSFKRLKQIKMRNVKLEDGADGDDEKLDINDLVLSFQAAYQKQIGFDLYLEKILFHNSDYYTLFIAKRPPSQTDTPN